MDATKCVFCPCCNYVVSKQEKNLLKEDVNCPNCGAYKVSKFYEYGSQTHIRNLMRWALREGTSARDKTRSIYGFKIITPLGITKEITHE